MTYSARNRFRVFFTRGATAGFAALALAAGFASGRATVSASAPLPQASTTKQASLLRVPFWNTWLNSAGWSSRAVRGKEAGRMVPTLGVTSG